MSSNRREFLRTAGAGMLATGAVSQPGGAGVPPARPSAQSAPGRKNVLVIVADDQGLHLGCYGDRVARTPNLDRLASQGVRFSNAFCTTASCSASRSVILTGLYNHASGQFGHAHLPANFHTHDSVRSLPRLLRDRGYLTGVIGKLHVLPEKQYPFEMHAEGAPRDLAGMARKAGELFRKAGEAKKPFYLHIGYGDPHRAGKGFGNDRSYPGITPMTYDPAKVEVPYFLPDQPEVRAEISEYLQAVNRLDQGVGMLLEELRKSGQEQETLVIYVSDNGMPFPGAKATLYEPGIHLPMIVRRPGMERRGLVNNAMVSWVDLVPTCLDWAGAAATGSVRSGLPDYPLHGRSLLPVIEQENPGGWDQVFLSHTFHEVINYYPTRGIRTRRHKYLRNLVPDLYPFPSDLFASQTWQGVMRRGDKMMGRRPVATFLRRPAEELYDLEKDPQELNNLAGSPQHTEVLATCRRKVDEMQAGTRDPWWEYLEQRRQLGG